MNAVKRAIAAAQFVLISPAALFMTALFVRSLQPLQYEPARTAQRIVMWYAGRLWTLWVLLFALPLAVLVIGCAALRTWNRGLQMPHGAWQTQPTARFVIAETFTAAGILVVVVLHMLRN